MSFGSHASFKWKGKSCPDGEVGSCCIGHSDILVTDGQCPDEFLHCADPGLEQERISVTFRWIKQHSVSSPLRTGIVCCLPTCAQGSSAAVTGKVGDGAFWALWVLLGVLCIWGVLALLVFLLMSARLELRRRWTRPLGGGRRGHSLRDPREFTALHKNVLQVIMEMKEFHFSILYVPALARLPSLHFYFACMVLWVQGAFRRNCRQYVCKTSFSRVLGFSV